MPYELSDEQLRRYLWKPYWCPWCAGEVTSGCLDGDGNYLSEEVHCCSCGRQWMVVYRAVGLYFPDTEEHRYLPESDPGRDDHLWAAAPDLVAVCQEIANDPQVDLVFSERRLRLYSALHKANAL